MGYSLAYLYELGYLSYYGINDNFVNITPTQILKGSLAAIAAVIIWDALFSIYENRVVTYDKSQVRERFKREMLEIFYVALCVLFVVLLISLASTTFFLFYIFLSIFLLVYIVTFLQILVKYLKLKSWSESLSAFFKDTDKRNSDSRTKSKPLDMERVYFLSLILIACCASYLYGHVNALPTTQADTPPTTKISKIKVHQYTIVDTNDKYVQVVIRRYSDTLLIKEYDAKNKKFTDGFKTEKVEDKRFLNRNLEFKS